MPDVLVATPADVAELRTLHADGAFHADYVADGTRFFADLERAAARGEVVLARQDGRLAGACRLFVQPEPGRPTLVTTLGGVFDGYERRGLGGLLVDAMLDQVGAVTAAGLVEVWVDSTSPHLDRLLEVRGFEAERFDELTCGVSARRTEDTVRPLPRALRTRAIAADEIDDLGKLYAATYTGLAGTPDGMTVADRWRRTGHLRTDLSRLVTDDAGKVSGFAIVLVWPDEPEDLWLESVCVADPEPEVGRYLVDTLRSTARANGFVSLSVGTRGGPMAVSYRELGFVQKYSWARHSLIVASL